MKMNSGFNIDMITTSETKPRVLIQTVESAHLWTVDEASSYQMCDHLHRVCGVMLILLLAFDRGLSNSIHKSKVNPVNTVEIQS